MYLNLPDQVNKNLAKFALPEALTFQSSFYCRQNRHSYKHLYYSFPLGPIIIKKIAYFLKICFNYIELTRCYHY
jgi:hypothetical protein